MGVYDRQRASVKVKIEEKGEACKYRNITKGVTNPDKPWEPPKDVTLEFDVSILTFAGSGGNLGKVLAALSGTEIETGGRIAYMGNYGFKPTLNDIIVRADGSTLRIKDVDSLDPNGEGAIMYTLGILT